MYDMKHNTMDDTKRKSFFRAEQGKFLLLTQFQIGEEKRYDSAFEKAVCTIPNRILKFASNGLCTELASLCILP